MSGVCSTRPSRKSQLRVELGTFRGGPDGAPSAHRWRRPTYPHNRRGDPDLELGCRPPGWHSPERRIQSHDHADHWL